MGLFSGRRKKTKNTHTDFAQNEETCVAKKTVGPFDSKEVQGPGNRIDAGALWLPPAEGTSIQFITDESQTQVIGVVYILGDSALQMQVFAAPKSANIWDEVRLDMRTSIAGQGGSSKEMNGPFGKELMANMPVANSKNFAPHRFLGIDGPRWMLRASLYGRAGSDPRAAAGLLEILAQTVVYRGEEPRTPRELLPLRLPHIAKK